MTDTSRLWKVLGAILLLSFGLLLFMGREIYLAAPPMPEAVQTASGETLFTLEDLHTGREVWQTMGGIQVGSIWGHGAYVAPDWSADWLHREAVGLLRHSGHNATTARRTTTWTAAAGCAADTAAG